MEKEKENLSICREWARPRGNTENGDEREIEASIFFFFGKLRESELFKGKIFNFLIPKSQKLFEI